MTTHERILQAAVRRFARNAYDDVGLRDIANDVRVDVSYVHRCFGSKKALFAKALAETLHTRSLPPFGAGTFGEFISAMALNMCGPTEENGCALDIIVCSLNSREAWPILRETIDANYIRPVRENFPEVAYEDVALAFSALFGLSLLSRKGELNFSVSMDGADMHRFADRLRLLLDNQADN